MAIEHIHLSQQAKDQLVRLKRATGLTTWNTLCRWALCASLAEAGAPPPKKIPADSNVEMSWRVFAGTDGDVYLALLRERCIRDGLPTDPDSLAEQFRLHLHRASRTLWPTSELRASMASSHLPSRATTAPGRTRRSGGRNPAPRCKPTVSDIAWRMSRNPLRAGRSLPPSRPRA